MQMIAIRRTTWRWLLALFMVGAVTLAGWQGALAQRGYPEREITVIIPFAAGGSVDRMIRSLAPYWEKELGVPLVLQNYEGAQGQLGFERFVRMPADGYTILVGTEPYLSASILRGASYTLADFDFLNIQQFDPVAITVNASSPYRTLSDLLEAIKARPNTLAWGVEPGGWDYVMGSLIFGQLGLKVREVFYDGGGPLRVALMGGQVDFTLGSAAGDVSMGDRARVLAVSGTSRFPAWPDAPTLNEALESYGIQVPNLGSIRFVAVHSALKRQYPERYEVLLRTYERAINNPEYRQRIAETAEGLVTLYMGPGAASLQIAETHAVVNRFRDIFLGE